MSDEDLRRARSARAVGLFFGWLLLVAGALLGGLGGACVLAFASGGAEMSGLAWALGGGPLLIGGILFASGIAILVTRGPRPEPKRADLAAFSDDPPEDAP